MRVDLHGLPLSEAKLKAQISVAESWSDSELAVELIHGHNLGTAIKDYIQNPEGLRTDISRIYPEMPQLKLSDRSLGSTVIKFRRR